jgi:uncharacterized membrane protein
MMVLFHFMFDLVYFAGHDINVRSGFWWIFAKVTAIIFVGLVGVSLALSSARRRDPRFPRYFWRGAKIFFLGMIISLATYLLAGQAYVRFGVLHLIGLSIVLAYPFLRLKWTTLAVGFASIVAGIWLNTLEFGF